MIKKILVIVLVLFLVWFLLTDPAGASSMVREIGETIWDLLVQLFTAMSRFISGLLA